jgi:pimeloyl-ACP methyl ester carboxylesterase
VPGSGPITRDGIAEVERIEGVAPPFAVWARILAKDGYASYRYDKQVTKLSAEYATGVRVCRSLQDEYLDDVLSALHIGQIFYNKRKPLVLIGHSLGGLAATLIADDQPEVDAVVSISAPVESLPSTLIRQLAGIPSAEKRDQALGLLHGALSGNTAEPIFGAHSAYWQQLNTITMEKLLITRRREIPILLLQGSDDRLVPSSMFEELAERLRSSPGLDFSVVRGADHFLMTHRPEGNGHDGDYELGPVIKWLDRSFAPRQMFD